MRYKIIPTVFSINEEDFLDRFSRLVNLSKDIQIDFMDGKFVPSQFLDIDVLPDLKRLKNNFEAHLMVYHPEKYIKRLKDKGFKKIIFHYEAFHTNDDVISLARKIKKEKLLVFLAINPFTRVQDLLLLVKEFDGVLFMGVYPGKEHQLFVYDVLEHISQLRHFYKKIDIQVDGGINTSNIHYISKAGANLFNTGSFVAENKDPRNALKLLKKELKW
jgi:ribulose-phosphate 3-epimerase